MGKRARWQSTRKRVAFAPTTTTMRTIEPDGALVLLPESTRAGKRRRLSLRRLTRRRQQLKHRSRVQSYRFRHRMLGRRSCLPQWTCRRTSSLRSAAGIICDADAAAMREHDFADDGEAEAGAFLLFTRAAPEPLENVLAILWRHAAAAIGHFDAAGTIDRHVHFRSRRRVSDRVLDQVPEGIFERMNVCFHVHWPVGS